VLARKAASTLLDCRERRPRELQRLALALAGHDPQRTLERGYALVSSPQGEPLVSATAARERGDVRLRFADGELGARIREE
jgi:exodeoxyribonuclease VII large subunit